MDIIKNNKGEIIAKLTRADYPIRYEVETETGLRLYKTEKTRKGGITTSADNVNVTQNVKTNYI